MKLLKKLVALVATTAIMASGVQMPTLAETETGNFGSRIFKENGTLNVEVAWENDESNPPLVVVAEYDTDGRLLFAHRIDAKDGYFKGDTGIVPSDAETKLFVWDGKTQEPIYDTVIYEESSDYVFPASQYMPQSNRTTYSRFSYGGGIMLESRETLDVSKKAELYVNNARYFGTAVQSGDYYNPYYEYIITDEILDKFLANAQGDIRVSKSDSSLEKYDRIYVDYYEVGQVSSVSYRSGLTTVQLKVMNDVPSTPHLRFAQYCTLEIDDTSVEMGNVDISTERNGQAVQLKELQTGDAVAFAMDFDGWYYGASSALIRNPDSIKILATDKTITGVVVDYDDYSGTFTIDDTAYKYVGYTDYILNIGTTYELPLDPFGRILNEGLAISNGYKFAIVEKYNQNTEQVQLLLSDGTTASYEVHSVSEIGINALPSFIKTGGVMNPVQDRVVTYKISGGRVRLSPAYSVQIDGKYNPNTGKIGSVSISDYLSVINAKAYVDSSSPSVQDYATFDIDDFKTDVNYVGYAYKTCDVYEFMILTSTGETFTKGSRFAVVTKGPSNILFDGEVCVAVDALYNGEAIKLYSDTGLLGNTSEGDVIYFTTNKDGYLESIYKIYDRDEDRNYAQEAFYGMPAGAYNASDWNFSFAQSTATIQLVSGYITNIKDDTITLGVISEDPNYGKIINGNRYDKADGTEGLFTFDLAYDAQAYVFDETYDTIQNHKKYSTIDTSSIIASKLEEVVYDGYTVDYVYDAQASTLNSAMALIINDEVVEIFINQKNAEEVDNTPTVPEAPTDNFAIAEKFNQNTEQVQLLLADGTGVYYEIHPASDLNAINISSYIKPYGYLAPVQDRVVTYTISEGLVKLTPASEYMSLYYAEYNSKANRLGSVAITEYTNIINAQDHEESSSPSIYDYEVFDVSTMKHGEEYTGYAFKSGSVYSFIIITGAGTIYTEESRFAVITRNPARKILDGFTCVGAEALYNGAETTLYWDTTTIGDVAYGEGDVIYFTVNSEGFVEDEILIYSRTDDTVDAATNFAAFLAAHNNAYDAADWRFGFADGVEDIQIVKGYVTEVKNNGITFGLVDSGIIDGNTYDDPAGLVGMYTFGLDADCQAYLYDGGMQSNQEYKKYSSISAASIPESILVEDDVNDYEYIASESILNEAIALVVNGDVVCIFVNCPQ